jgi:hypothetical protein
VLGPEVHAWHAYSSPLIFPDLMVLLRFTVITTGFVCVVQFFLGGVA